jgi:hypothetical protein
MSRSVPFPSRVTLAAPHEDSVNKELPTVLAMNWHDRSSLLRNDVETMVRDPALG